MKGSIPPQYLQLRLWSLSIRILSTRVGLKITDNVGPASVSLRIFHLSNPFKSINHIQIIFKSIEIHLQRLRQFLVPTWVQPGQHRWENWSWGGDSRIWIFRKRYLEQQGFVAIVGPKTQIGSLDPSHPWCRQSTLARVDLAQSYLSVKSLSDSCSRWPSLMRCRSWIQCRAGMVCWGLRWSELVSSFQWYYSSLHLMFVTRCEHVIYIGVQRGNGSSHELSIVCQLNCTLGYIGHYVTWDPEKKTYNKPWIFHHFP